MVKGAKYTVVELAGYVGENDRKSFGTFADAADYLEDEYGEAESDERERLKPDIAIDLPDGSRTYDY